MFSGCTVQPDSKETKLGISDREACPSASKNTRIILVPCRAWKCVPTTISGGAAISEIPECHLLQQMSSLFSLLFAAILVHKNYFTAWCLINAESTFLVLTYF